MNLKKVCLYLVLTYISLLLIILVDAQTHTAYHTKFVHGSTNNRLEVLDWGGNGKPLLFLSGLTNTAHVFADFAPKFTDKFHVYGLTRRGFGASSQDVASYNRKTLAADILAIIDSLHLDKVMLIGHSIAGDEITKFASFYPDKVDKVVYLDAAYDYTNLLNMASHEPTYPTPSVRDSSSFLHYKKFLTSIMGVSFPDEEMKNTNVFSAGGKYQKGVTSDSILGVIINENEHPNFKSVGCPALAIYAVQTSVNQLFPFYNALDAENKKRADTTFSLYVKWEKEQRQLFKEEVKRGTAKEITGAPHYIFIANPDETEKYIRDFLQ